jgi:hypothetical protein
MKWSAVPVATSARGLAAHTGTGPAGHLLFDLVHRLQVVLNPLAIAHAKACLEPARVFEHEVEDAGPSTLSRASLRSSAVVARAAAEERVEELARVAVHALGLPALAERDVALAMSVLPVASARLR